MKRAEARALFAELRSIATRSEEIVTLILEQRAWEAAGYPTLADAWVNLIGEDFVVGSRRLRWALAIQFAQEDRRSPARGVSDTMIRDMVEALNLGLSPERIMEHASTRSASPTNIPEVEEARRATYARRAGRASLPERPYRVTVEFTQAEVERFGRIAKAHSSNITTVAKQAILRRFDFLESELQVSV